MYGFIGGINIEKDLLYIKEHNSEELISDEKESEEFVIKRLTLNKFYNDKICYESDEIIIVIEGVIYNFASLTKKYAIEDRGLLLERIYRESEMSVFCNILDGYYSGVLYDKIKKITYVFTDHIGYRPVWYYCENNLFVFSSDIDWMYHSVAAFEKQFLPDEDAFISMLNYGYVLGNRTLNRNIKKLLSGHYLCFSDNMIDIGEYYSLPLPDNKQEKSRIKILEEIDYCITEAVKKAYEKDAEYGYKHIMTLSGGLDSRVLLFKACQLGYKTTCITMGEANCTDIRISSQICDDLNQEHLIYELNNGLYLSDIESAVEANGGTIMWPGFAHGYRLRQLIDLRGYGAIHSGDLGDVILGGSYYEGSEKNNINRIDLRKDVLAYGRGFIGQFSNQFREEEINRYSNKVLFNYYNRGVNSAGNGVFATHYYTEGSSPLISKSILNLMFSLPYEYTKEHKLYFEYLKEYMPKACEYIWEHSGCKPGAGYLQKEFVKWKRRISYRVFHKFSSMNPYDKWYGNNKALRDYLDEVYSDINNMSYVSDSILQVIKRKYRSNNTLEKTLACVAVTVLKKYGANVDHEI